MKHNTRLRNLQEISVKFLISLASIPFWRDSIHFGESQFILERCNLHFSFVPNNTKKSYFRVEGDYFSHQQKLGLLYSSFTMSGVEAVVVSVISNCCSCAVNTVKINDTEWYMTWLSWLCGSTYLVHQLEMDNPPYQKLSRIVNRRSSLVSTNVIGAVIKKCFRTQNWFEVDGLIALLTTCLQENAMAAEKMIWTLVSSSLVQFSQHQCILIQEIFVNGGMHAIPNEHDYAAQFDEKLTYSGFDLEKLLHSAISLQPHHSRNMAWKAFASVVDHSKLPEDVHEDRYDMLLQSLYELIINNMDNWQGDGKFYALKGLGTLARHTNKKFTLPLSMKADLRQCGIDFGRTGRKLGKSFSLQVMFDFC